MVDSECLALLLINWLYRLSLGITLSLAFIKIVYLFTYIFISWYIYCYILNNFEIISIIWKGAKNSESSSPKFSSCLHLPHVLSFTFSFPEHTDFFQTWCLSTAKQSSVHLPKVGTLSYITTIHPASQDCVSAHYRQTMNWWSHSDVANCSNSLLFLFCPKFYPGIHVAFSCHILDVFFNL